MTSVSAHPVQPDYEAKPVTVLRDVVIKAISFVNKGANGKRFFLFKNEEGTGTTDELYELSPLIKSDNGSDPWEVAYCVIAEPGDVDRQKDVWTAEDIQKAAHSFIQSGALLNEMHQDMAPHGDLVESAVALADFSVPTPDGTVETIKKGSWYIAVRPNEDMRDKMEQGEITGMSVQGSARRVEVKKEDGLFVFPINKALDKDDEGVPMGTEGPGIVKVQNILGIQESGTYDEATDEAVVKWMKASGTPGRPSIATLKLILSSATPAAPAQAPVEQTAPASAVIPQEAEKAYGAPESQGGPFNPADGSHSEENIDRDSQSYGAQPNSTGVDAAQITVDSPIDDLKAVVAKSVQEGNEELVAYLNDKLGGVSMGDIYGSELTHEELWFVISKYILGSANQKVLNEQGEFVQANEVEKDVDDIAARAGGSHGGHDPRKHGKIRFIVRSFGKWANGSQAVAARKLLDKGVVSTPEAADRLAAWLKDQWLGHTKWRKGNKRIGKAFSTMMQKFTGNDYDPHGEMNPEGVGELFKAIVSELDMDMESVLDKCGCEDEKELDKSFDEMIKAIEHECDEHCEHGEEEAPEAGSAKDQWYGKSDNGKSFITASSPITVSNTSNAHFKAYVNGKEAKPKGVLHKVAAALESDESAEQVVAKVVDLIKTGGAEEVKELAPAIEGLRDGLTAITEITDPEERDREVKAVLADFTKWVKQTLAAPASNAEESHGTSAVTTNNSLLVKGENMDQFTEEDRNALSHAVGFLSSILDGGQAAAPAEVEKDAEEDQVAEAPEVHAEEHEAPAEAPAEAEAEEAPEAEEAAEVPEAEAAGDDEDVSLGDVVSVVNSVIEDLDNLTERIGSLEELGNKLDKVGELAKALQETDQVEILKAELSETQQALSSTREELMKRLEDVENTPEAPSSVPVDTPALREMVVKADNNDNNMWAGVF